MDHCCKCVGKPQVRPVLKDVFAVVVFCLVPVVVGILAAFSIIPSLGAPKLPSFDKPLKGFEPRGTELSNRENTLQRTFQTALRSNPPVLTFRPPDNATIRRRRSSSPRCSNRIYIDYSNKFVFKSTSGASLFNAKDLKTMCTFAKKLSQSTPSCPSYSIGYYVAMLNNRSFCEDITEEDVSKSLLLLKNCSSYFTKGLLTENCKEPGNCNSKVPVRCTDFNAVYNILYYLSDSLFLSTESSTKLKYSLVVYRSHDFRDEDVYYESLEKLTDPDDYPKENGIQLAAFSFGYMKFDIFSKKLISEIIYPALAMALVFFIMILYLQSIILAIHALECVIFALVIAYFLYHFVFGIKFFPFLNVTVFVFLVGIGADDAFVYYDIWCQTKEAFPTANVVTLTWKTLRYAALSMFVTSLTTASAFFASVSSDITAIKCFGIFAGTSILANYLMMVTYFPAVVLLHERYILKRPATVKTRALEKKLSAVEMDRVANENMQTGTAESDEDDSLAETMPCCLRVFDYPCVFIRLMNSVSRRVSSKLFLDWLPTAVIKLRWLWLVVFLGLTVGFLFVDFLKPGLRLPISKDFQVFSASHPLEQFSLHYKTHFRFSQLRASGREIVLIWGIKPVDNGDHLNPDERGRLEFDSSFDMFEPEAQTWLLSLCTSITNKTFYVPRANDCLMRVFKSFMSQPCGFYSLPSPCCNNSAFPFSKDLFRNCLIRTLSAQYQWYNGPFFDKATGQLKGLMISYQSNIPYTNEYKVTNKFWNEIKPWADTILSEAPSGLRNGWVISWNMDFYSLQTSITEGTKSSMGIAVAIAFAVMLLTTLNIFISLYAIVTIIGIITITVGCLVLAGWYLNILESIVMTVAVGLSIDFTMHYGVAYRLSPVKDKRDMRVRYSIAHIGSAVTMASITTFITGVMMMPSVVLAYIQLGQFLMIVMVMSWFYGTFIFQAMCSLVGPRNNFGQLSISRFFRSFGCKVQPEKKEIDSLPKENEDVSDPGSRLPAYASHGASGETNNELENNLVTVM